MAAAIKQPGWYRGALGALLGAAFGYFLVVGLRLRAILGLDAYSRPSRPAIRISSFR